MSNIPERLEQLRRELTLAGYTRPTLKSYTAMVGRFLEYAHGIIGKSDPVDIAKDYLLELKKDDKSVGYINLHVCALRFFFNKVMRLDLNTDFLGYMKRPKYLPEIFSLEEIGAILSAVKNKKHRLLMEMCFGCGLRVGELVNIRMCDIHRQEGYLRLIGKGEKERRVSIKDIPADLLDLQMQGKEWNHYLFQQWDNPRVHISTRSAQNIMKNACGNVGIMARTNIHKLRHSFAVALLDNGTDISKIQKIMGHSNIKTTQLYARASNEMILKVQSPLARVLRTA